MSDSDNDRKPKGTGRVRHEPGGRAVWQWAVESGKHAIDSTSRLLKRLDLSGLRILEEDERLAARRAADEAAGKVDPSKAVPTFGGEAEKDSPAEAKQTFDPYNSRTPVGRGLPPPKAKAPPKPRITQPVRPATKKSGFFGKLFGK